MFLAFLNLLAVAAVGALFKGQATTPNSWRVTLESRIIGKISHGPNPKIAYREIEIEFDLPRAVAIRGLPHRKT
jgi:hypothetical protein